VCSSPICSEKHLVFYHIFSQFFTNIFEFLNLKTENGEKYRNSISQLLAETENFPVFRRFSAGKLNPGRTSSTNDPSMNLLSTIVCTIMERRESSMSKCRSSASQHQHAHTLLPLAKLKFRSTPYHRPRRRLCYTNATFSCLSLATAGKW